MGPILYKEILVLSQQLCRVEATQGSRLTTRFLPLMNELIKEKRFKDS